MFATAEIPLIEEEEELACPAPTDDASVVDGVDIVLNVCDLYELIKLWVIAVVNKILQIDSILEGF